MNYNLPSKFVSLANKEISLWLPYVMPTKITSLALKKISLWHIGLANQEKKNLALIFS
jgi:hypothetical protein